MTDTLAAEKTVWDFKDNDFGNSWLTNFAEVTSAPDISWVPNTPLGWSVALLLTLLLLRKLWQKVRDWQRNGYRREAIQQLQKLQAQFQQGDTDAIKYLPQILRQCVLAVLPRDQVVALSNERWLKFLMLSNAVNATSKSEQDALLTELMTLPYISPNQRQMLSQKQGNQFFHWCHQWLLHHELDNLATTARRALAQ